MLPNMAWFCDCLGVGRESFDDSSAKCLGMFVSCAVRYGTVGTVQNVQIARYVQYAQIARSVNYVEYVQGLGYILILCFCEIPLTRCADLSP